MITKEHTTSTNIHTSHESMILTIDEAAAYLAIPKATLYTWRTRRVGFGARAVKMVGCLSCRRADLDALLGNITAEKILGSAGAIEPWHGCVTPTATLVASPRLGRARRLRSGRFEMCWASARRQRVNSSRQRPG